jgi:hypothetical protein
MARTKYLANCFLFNTQPSMFYFIESHKLYLLFLFLLNIQFSKTDDSSVVEAINFIFHICVQFTFELFDIRNQFCLSLGTNFLITSVIPFVQRCIMILEKDKRGT